MKMSSEKNGLWVAVLNQTKIWSTDFSGLIFEDPDVC